MRTDTRIGALWGIKEGYKRSKAVSFISVQWTLCAERSKIPKYFAALHS
jgi:hypothetical protein